MTTTTSQPNTSRLDIAYATFGIVAGIGLVVTAQALLSQWGNTAALPVAAAAPVMQAAAGEVQTMGLPLVTGTKAYWFLARAGGVTAYFLLWFATLWGVLIANGMYLPLSTKLKRLSELEVKTMEMLLDGVLAVQAGISPRMVEQKLRSALPNNSKSGEEKAA